MNTLSNCARVVFIYDALDQVEGKYDGLVKLWSADDRFRCCHVIVTGRTFSFRDDRGSKKFNENSWTFATLLGFDANQQARYLDDCLQPDPQSAGTDREVDETFKSIFRSYDEIQKLLEVPGLIEMVRGILIDEGKTAAGQVTRLAGVKNRCDLHWKYYEKRILDKARTRLEPAPDQQRWGSLWELMLATIAFRMVLDAGLTSPLRGTTTSRGFVTAFSSTASCSCLRSVPPKTKTG